MRSVLLALPLALAAATAHAGILMHPPENVVREFPQYPVVRDYAALRAEIDKASARI